MHEKTLLHIALGTSGVGIALLFLFSTSLGAGFLREGPYRVTHVVDGDTIDIDTGERIRLSGINAPEAGECYADKATRALETLVLGKEIYLEHDFEEKDKYGRTLGYLYVNDTFVNGYLVQDGFVKVFDKYRNETRLYDALKEIEEEPKSENLGIWACTDPKEGCLYVASKNSKVYHKPDCKWAKKIKPENLICFHSEEELIGYEPAKSC